MPQEFCNRRLEKHVFTALNQDIFDTATYSQATPPEKSLLIFYRPAQIVSGTMQSSFSISARWATVLARC
jgi:hypothetical protein